MEKKVFDNCLKNALNEMRIFYHSGLPDYNVKPFDPHYGKFIEQRRGDAGTGLFGYKLVLSDVYEYGWADSKITSLRTDPENDRFVYSQYFGNKSLTGNYDFRARILGAPIHTKGSWNLVLGDYSQTTSVKRTNGPNSLLKINVEVDQIGKMSLHISDLFNGRKQLENVMDFLINAAWQPSLVFVKPLINDLVSTAFTDIFNESFRYFPVHEIIH
ncbi:uncharacterized protein LOC134829031 [Culicoides brevitarsis]|uniref:uncharacterized protein LOC134829031 n=1 Tax=Culicoides brevitarsis TaxID=469753 RepID=UPI00307BE772